jgi:hypothetical protein
MHSPDNLEDDTAAQRPCAGGLLAGTLALMTCWAAPEPEAKVDAQKQRSLIARKVVSNLFFLRDHPDVGPGLQQVVGRLHQRWVLIAQDAAITAPPLDLAAEAAPTGAALH